MGKREVAGVIRFESDFVVEGRGSRQVLAGTFKVDQSIIFLPWFRATITADTGATFTSQSQPGNVMAWLPRGNFRLEISLPGGLGPEAGRCIWPIVCPLCSASCRTPVPEFWQSNRMVIARLYETAMEARRHPNSTLSGSMLYKLLMADGCPLCVPKRLYTGGARHDGPDRLFTRN